jgi:hypothetical protein
MTAVVSRETAIGLVVTVVALVAMAFDHLVGNDPGLDDPVAFLIAAVLTLGAAAIVFGLVVPRAKADPNPGARAAKQGFILSLVSVLAIALIWLGVTFVLAGGAIALGLLGRRSERGRVALAAIVIGAIVLGMSVVFSDWTSST